MKTSAKYFGLAIGP